MLANETIKIPIKIRKTYSLKLQPIRLDNRKKVPVENKILINKIEAQLLMKKDLLKILDIITYRYLKRTYFKLVN